MYSSRLVSHYPRHRGRPQPPFTGDPILFRVHFPLSLEITCARVSFPECTLYPTLRNARTSGSRESRGRVRDVTLAVVTISIPRFEPPRIADCGRVHDGSDVRIQTGMSAASRVSIMRTTAKRALAEVRRVRIFERCRTETTIRSRTAERTSHESFRDKAQQK